VNLGGNAIAATAHLPLDHLFWYAGNHDSMYPLLVGCSQAHCSKILKIQGMLSH